ncbi:hypothetical protein B0T25DRAFT_239860 [Lasiosphaeria hispida]|uniref:Uncharacterized protein n=1 Tax=Lasiosphaeria hispida TaxID=260671 RepID=A0AAJ0MCB9_9PEZI|nr:hypothetical protein B0T25DRAFT_239860 [Lasiosphaeria hispida]
MRQAAQPPKVSEHSLRTTPSPRFLFCRMVSRPRRRTSPSRPVRANSAKREATGTSGGEPGLLYGHLILDPALRASVSYLSVIIFATAPGKLGCNPRSVPFPAGIPLDLRLCGVVRLIFSLSALAWHTRSSAKGGETRSASPQSCLIHDLSSWIMTNRNATPKPRLRVVGLESSLYRPYHRDSYLSRRDGRFSESWHRQFHGW